MFNKVYLSREQTRAASEWAPVGDPFGGPAYGERNDPITATLGLGAVAGGIGLYEGKKNRKQASQAMDMQSQQMEAQLELQREQLDMAREDRDYMRGMAQEDRDYKRGIYNEMLNDARVDPGTYDLMTGRAASDVVKSFDAVRGARERDMMRYGLNPTSGRWQAMTNANALDEAAAVAGAQNNTRLGLRNFEQSALMSARGAGLGLPLNITSNPMMPVMSEMAATRGANAQMYGNAAAGYNQAASAAVNSGLSGAGMLLGYGLSQPTVTPTASQAWV